MAHTGRMVYEQMMEMDYSTDRKDGRGSGGRGAMDGRSTMRYASMGGMCWSADRRGVSGGEYRSQSAELR